MIYPWQESAWSQLQQDKGRQHHALLLHGPAGIGKRRFAETFAATLLCTRGSEEGLPCGVCNNCRWFGQGTHPDFRLLTPDALRPEAEVAAETPAEEGSRGEKKSATQITVEQIRELQRFLSLSAHVPGGRRVVLIHPADCMNVFAANALLKLLEEPPAQTVFLLICDEFRRLLPTIISRCYRYPMPGAERSQALAWLRQQGVGEAEVLLAQAGGAPVAVLALAAAGMQESRRYFLDQLSGLAGPGSALALAAVAQKMALPSVVRWLATWCYDLLAARLAGSIRYHPDYQDVLESLASRLALDRLLIYLDLLKAAAASVAHPLNPRLFLEQLLLSYSHNITASPINSHV